jgi:hypothetical protein
MPEHSSNYGGNGGSQGYGGGASISDTGRNSDNSIRATYRSNYQVTNNNNVTVNNSNTQYAVSGNAYSHDNRGGGDATTGDASNWNSTTTNVSINN